MFWVKITCFCIWMNVWICCGEIRMSKIGWELRMGLYDITTDAQKLTVMIRSSIWSNQAASSGPKRSHTCNFNLDQFQNCLPLLMAPADVRLQQQRYWSISNLTSSDDFISNPNFQSQWLEMGKNVGSFLHRRHQRLANVSRDGFNPPAGAVDRLFI